MRDQFRYSFQPVGLRRKMYMAKGSTKSMGVIPSAPTRAAANGMHVSDWIVLRADVKQMYVEIFIHFTMLICARKHTIPYTNVITGATLPTHSKSRMLPESVILSELA